MIHSVSPYLLVREQRPLVFKVIIEMCVLILVNMFFFVFFLFLFLFFGVVVCVPSNILCINNYGLMFTMLFCLLNTGW